MGHNAGHRKIGDGNERLSAFLTIIGYQWPPRAVEMPRAFNTSAID
jgi:hypothetical protein